MEPPEISDVDEAREDDVDSDDEDEDDNEAVDRFVARVLLLRMARLCAFFILLSLSFLFGRTPPSQLVFCAHSSSRCPSSLTAESRGVTSFTSSAGLAASLGLVFVLVFFFCD